jgi:hypothetical protein
VTALVDSAKTDPTAQIDALPVMAMETVSPTVPTLPVAIVPSSWIDRSASKFPTAAVDELPLITTLPMP